MIRSFAISAAGSVASGRLVCRRKEEGASVSRTASLLCLTPPACVSLKGASRSRLSYSGVVRLPINNRRSTFALVTSRRCKKVSKSCETFSSSFSPAQGNRMNGFCCHKESLSTGKQVKCAPKQVKCTQSSRRDASRIAQDGAKRNPGKTCLANPDAPEGRHEPAS